MKTSIRIQLSSMMFLNYFIWGAWYVTMGTYLLQGLSFAGEQVGIAYGAAALAAMISPFFMGMVADRFFPAERVLGVLHIVGAITMYMAAQVTEFSSFYPILLIHTLCYMPTIALTNSICFHQMNDIGTEFPPIRAFGTIGWIIQGLLIAFLGRAAFMNDITAGTNIEATNFPFLLAAGASVLMGIYSFTLPSTPPKSKGQSVDWKQLIGLDALSLLRDRSFLVLFLASLLICIPLSFYYGFTNPYLNEIGFADAAGKMTFGQMSEMLFLFIMPFFFKRLGVKNMMLIGMGAWVLRYILFAYGNADDMVWMLYLGIILHGICYDFFFVTGQIYADDRAPEHLKSSVQGLMTFATYGVGMFIGTWASGKVVDLYTIGEQAHNWTQIWMIPAVFAVGVLVLFGLFFKNPKQG